MILEFIFYSLAAYVLYRGINSLGSGRPAIVMQPKKLPPQLEQMITLADRLYEQRRYVAAEKAYVNVLKVDHKNLQSYKRLGLIYTALKNYPDAVECLQIAAQLAPSAQSYYALGLVLYENQNYIKAISAFEKAIIFEPSASRYISLAKAFQKLANTVKAISALEHAAGLDPTKEHLRMLAEAYLANRDRARAQATFERILEIDPNDARARHYAKSLAT